MTPEDIIKALDLEPHVEGGHYRRTYRHADGPEGRGYASAIYYLVMGRDPDRWHQMDADEIWHWYAGSPLRLEISETRDGTPTEHILGNRLALGERPQILVPANFWQRATSLGGWTLVGCTVSPGFSFDGHILD